jgi:hypothetical protein
MKINPESPNPPRQSESTKDLNRSGKTFGDTLTSKTPPNVSASALQTSAESVKGLSQKDLADPAKVEAAIDQAVQDLLKNEFGGMCKPDREHIASWLRSDPMVRAALLQRLSSS